GPGERLGPRQRLPAEARLALPDQHEAEMGEWGEVAARAQRPAGWDDRHHAGREQFEQQPHRLDADAGRALGERVRPQERRRPHHLVREGVADAAGVAAQEVQLQLGGLLGRDLHVDKAAEAGVHAVGGRALGDDAVDERPRGGELLERLRAEHGGLAADGNPLDVVDVQIVSVQLDRRRHGRAAYLPNSPPAATSSTRSGAMPSIASAAPAAAAAVAAGMRPTSSPRSTSTPRAAASCAISPTTTWSGVAATSIRFIDTWARPVPASRRPRACTPGRPPSRSRTAAAIARATSTSSVRRSTLNATSGGRTPSRTAPALGCSRAGPYSGTISLPASFAARASVPAARKAAGRRPSPSSA